MQKFAYSVYRPSDFGFPIEYTKENADICMDCSNKIAEAQNETIEKIKNNL